MINCKLNLLRIESDIVSCSLSKSMLIYVCGIKIPKFVYIEEEHVLDRYQYVTKYNHSWRTNYEVGFATPQLLNWHENGKDGQVSLFPLILLLFSPWCPSSRVLCAVGVHCSFERLLLTLFVNLVLILLPQGFPLSLVVVSLVNHTFLCLCPLSVWEMKTTNSIQELYRVSSLDSIVFLPLLCFHLQHHLVSFWSLPCFRCLVIKYR